MQTIPNQNSSTQCEGHSYINFTLTETLHLLYIVSAGIENRDCRNTGLTWNLVLLTHRLLYLFTAMGGGGEALILNTEKLKVNFHSKILKNHFLITLGNTHSPHKNIKHYRCSHCCCLHRTLHYPNTHAHPLLRPGYCHWFEVYPPRTVECPCANVQGFSKSNIENMCLLTRYAWF